MSAWRGYAVVASAAALLGVGATALAAMPQNAGSVGPSEQTLVAVGEEQFSDPRPVQVTLVPGEQHDARSGVSGTVTSVECNVGDSLATGDSWVAIDQQPVVVISSDAPLFRDLVGGETGADVRELQVELRQLGYAAGESGQYDRATRNAVRDFFADRGVAQSGVERGVLRASTVTWVPRGSRISECPVRVGAHVALGEPLARVGGQGARVEIPISDGTMAGGRVVVMGGERILITELPITSPESVAAVFATAEAQAALHRNENVVNATTELVEPIEVSVVPPSALFGVSESHACLFDGTNVREVSIVSSSLGRSYVVVDGRALTHVDPFPAGERVCR